MVKKAANGKKRASKNLKVSLLCLCERAMRERHNPNSHEFAFCQGGEQSMLYLDVAMGLSALVTRPMHTPLPKRYV